MFLIWKGRGILTVVYLFVAIIGMYLLTGVVGDALGGYFDQVNTILPAMGLAFIIAGLLTYFTSLTHRIKDGVKVRIKSNHSFFFIPMFAWSIIFYILGAFIIALGISSFYTRH